MSIRVEIHVVEGDRQHIELIDIGNDALEAVEFRFENDSNPSHVAIQTLCAALAQKLLELGAVKPGGAVGRALDTLVEAQTAALEAWT